MEHPPPDPLQRRLETLEAELRLHEQERAKLEDLVRQMAAIVDSQQQANRYLEERLRAQRERVDSAEQAIAAILNSRIWKALSSAGGFALRLTGRQAPEEVTPVAEATPVALPEKNSVPESVSSAPKPKAVEELDPVPLTTVRTLAEWEGVLRGIAAGLPAPSGPAKIGFLTPTWNTKAGWLAEAALSVFAQTCPDWEWCIVDDGSTDREFYPLLDLLAELTPRVRIFKAPSGGISAATNRALAMATAPYVACLDHDDVLAPPAAERCLERLAEGYDAVYTDSDKIDEWSRHSEPFYKPAWSPVYLQGAMYVGHLLVMKREGALEVGGFRPEYDGVQDFEFLLRYSERFPRIGHVEGLLYHWRKVAGSVATASDAKGGKVARLQMQAVQEQLDRLGLPATAERGAFPHRVRVKPRPRQDYPLVSIIIPTKNAAPVLEQCLRSIFSRTTYPNFEVILADNDTSEPDALEVMRRFPVRRLFLPGKFHFSRFNNAAARETSGAFLIFANNDVEVITESWIEEMLYYAEHPRVGAVGALLLYPDLTVQHAGVVLGPRGTADHVTRGIPGNCDGYAGSLSCAREVSAVTAACLMIRRDRFEAVGGFNEHYFTAYQDVELCLRLRAKGWENIYTPHAQLIHHESYSRGKYYDMVDRHLLLDQWEGWIQAGDPYFNRHFDPQKADYTPA